MKKKVIWIIIIIVIILIILAIAGFYIFSKSGNLNFRGIGVDYSSGTKALNNIGEAVNTNSLDSVKLNPFSNSTG